MENMAKVTINGETKNIPVELPTGILSMNTRKIQRLRSYWSRWMGDFGSFIRGSRVTAR